MLTRAQQAGLRLEDVPRPWASACEEAAHDGGRASWFLRYGSSLLRLRRLRCWTGTRGADFQTASAKPTTPGARYGRTPR